MTLESLCREQRAKSNGAVIGLCKFGRAGHQLLTAGDVSERPEQPNQVLTRCGVTDLPGQFHCVGPQRHKWLHTHNRRSHLNQAPRLKLSVRAKTIDGIAEQRECFGSIP
jgi:hypothetical protein